MDLEKTEKSRLHWGGETAGQCLGQLDLESTQDDSGKYKWGDETSGHVLSRMDLEKTGTDEGEHHFSEVQWGI